LVGGDDSGVRKPQDLRVGAVFLRGHLEALPLTFLKLGAVAPSRGRCQTFETFDRFLIAPLSDVRAIGDLTIWK
jgi:hypothetical protein